MQQQRSIDSIKRAYPVDAELFGAMGAVAAYFCEDLSKSFTGRQFEFMDVGEYQAIAGLGQLSQVNQIYWREMLFRIHWAAALSIMRHQRWQAACTRAFTPPANLLGFAASLRGLLEGAVDAWYSLTPVPLSLAQNRTVIESALSRGMCDKLVVADFEDRLIHFVYAREVGKSERNLTPESHIALKPKEYRNAIGLPMREGFNDLYDELCGICHPTAFSMSLLWRAEGGRVQLMAGDDASYIQELCHKYEETMSTALSLSVTVSAMCLKALNWFSLPEVKCDDVERWDLDSVPAWKKAQAAVSVGIVH